MLNNLNDNILDSESILDTKLKLCKNNKKRQDVFIAWYFFKLLFIYLFVLKMERLSVFRSYISLWSKSDPDANKRH